MSSNLPVPTGDISDAAYEKLIAQLNDRDRQTGYDAVPMFVQLDGTSFVVKMNGAEEPIAKYDKLKVQLIYVKKTRALYSPDKEVRGPLCRSTDGNFHGVPRAETFEKLEQLQNMVLDMAGDKFPGWAAFTSPQLCDACLFNQWGTRLDGKSLDDFKITQGRGCGERKMLVMLHPDFAQPLTMSLSFSSIKNFNQYASGFAVRRPQRQFSEVLTELKAIKETSKKDPTQKYAVVTFSQASDWLSREDVMNGARLAIPYMGEDAAANTLDAEAMASVSKDNSDLFEAAEPNF